MESSGSPEMLATTNESARRSKPEEAGIVQSVWPLSSGYGLDGLGVGVRFPIETTLFSPLHVAHIGSGIGGCPIQWGLGALSLGVMWPGSEPN
jgi:hypothetical protein